MRHTVTRNHDLQPAMIGLALVGAAAGALAALLFAPKRGSEVRSDIRKRYNAAVDKTHQKLDDTAGKIKGRTEKLLTKPDRDSDAVKSAVKTAVSKSKTATQRTRKKPASQSK